MQSTTTNRIETIKLIPRVDSKLINWAWLKQVWLTSSLHSR